MATLDHLASLLLTRLAWTSLQAIALVGIVALLVRLLPRLPAAARCALWWLVGLQVLFGLCWQAPIRLPLLAPPATAIQVVTPHRATAVSDTHGTTHPTSATTLVGTAAPAAATPYVAASPTTATSWFSAHWRALLAALWLLLILAQIPSLVLQHRRTRRLRRDAKPLTDASLQAQCVQQAQALGLRRSPLLRVSSGIASPQVSGFWHPLVLWPAGHALTPTETALALAHELAHLKRGDLALGWIPALAQRLFFFHPLLRWAMHEYALHREAACDAQVLQQQRTVPQDYGRLLLRLGVGHPLHAGLAGASPTFHNLKRRLTMLQQTSSVMPRARGWLLVVLVALAGVLPYRVVAASHSTQNVDKVTTVADANTAIAPVPPAPPIPPAPPPPPQLLAPPPPPTDYGFNASHVDIDIDSNARQGFALFDDDSVMLNGTDADAAAVKRLHKSTEPMLWFRRGDRAYLIRDKATIERARNIYAPTIELARQEGRLAGEQGKISGQQAGLAARDAALAQAQAALAQQQERLAVEMATGQADADKRASDTQQRESDAQRRALDAQRRGLDAAQARLERKRATLRTELDAQRRTLEAQQAELEKHQHALEQRQQSASREAGQSMSKLLDEALAKDLAQDVSQR